MDKRVVLLVELGILVFVIALAMRLRHLRQEVDAQGDGIKRVHENLVLMREDMEDLQVRISALTDPDGGAFTLGGR